MRDTPLAILQHTFGYDAFRGHQEAIVRTLVAGENALVLMPTGGGKSLCYQIPALVQQGCAVVISPLIALVHDVVEALRGVGENAGFLNSTLSYEDVVATENALLAERLNLRYIAPERLVKQCA